MEKFNPHSNEWLLNKFNYYKELREADTAYWSEKYNMYVLTRYDDVLYALSNPDIFSSAQGNLIVESEYRFGRTLGASDNPVHDFFKNVVKEAYAKHNMDRIGSLYRTKVRELLTGEKILNLSDIADQSTAWATAEILNLPYSKERIQKLIVLIQRYSPQCVQNYTIKEVYDQLMRLLANAVKKKLPAPGPGIYNEYMNADRPEEFWGFSLFTGPTISGASSLTGAVEFMMLDLYRENRITDVLNDTSLIPAAVNESIRFNATTGRFSRTVTSPLTLHGVELKNGDRVALCYDAANRDPRQFHDPDVFDMTRNTVGLGFGHGLHACIALYFSKALMCIFLEEFINIVGNYRVLTANDQLQYVMTQSGNDDMISNILVEKI